MVMILNKSWITGIELLELNHWNWITGTELLELNYWNWITGTELLELSYTGIGEKLTLWVKLILNYVTDIRQLIIIEKSVTSYVYSGLLKF